jgi:hypothetical protein
MWNQADVDRVQAKQRAEDLADMRRTTRRLWVAGVVAVLLIIA